jgi:hypothetical protein
MAHDLQPAAVPGWMKRRDAQAITGGLKHRTDYVRFALGLGLIRKA